LISQGEPAWVKEVSGEAPVPPSKPEMVTWSARALATPRRDRADAYLRDQFHRDSGLLVDVLQVMDELRQVLDRIDVVGAAAG